MSLTEIVDRRYRSIVVVLFALGGSAWLMVGAISKFTDMVDERSKKVFESLAAKPFAEQEEMKRTITAQQRLIDAVIDSQRQMDRNLTKLLTVYDEERRTLPVRVARP